MKKKRTLIGLLILLLTYILLVNHIETKKIYPEEKEWFDLNIWTHSTNNSCIDLGESNIYYFNDPNRIHYTGAWNTDNLVLLDLNLRKKCDFGKLKISISAKDLVFPIYPVENNNTFQLNITNVNKFDLLLEDNESDRWFYRIELILPIDNNFFNYHRFSSSKIPLNVITFHYRNGLLNKGYYANENSFTVFDQAVYSERPVKNDKYKRYDFDNESSVLISFNPKSKRWFLFQKMLDAIILGLIVIGIYELLPNPKRKTIVKIKNYNPQSRYASL